MTKNTLKTGLSYISERTNQLRYSDKDKGEQWLHPLSKYFPLESIKRGQPVSVATAEELNKLKAENLTFEPDPNKVYVVLTNPSIHDYTVGLAMEATKSPFSTTEYTEQPEIHVLDHGRFDIDLSYLEKFGYIKDKDNEYCPEFLSNKENRGKKIFVKGVASKEDLAGCLTIIPEEAYLAHNNIIQIGFISDTFVNAGKNLEAIESKASIELQIEGDTRGPIDHTQIEAVFGENVSLSSHSPLRVFALGQEEAEKFQFSLKFNTTTGLAKNSFIALRRVDGKTYFLYTDGSTNPLSPEALNTYESEDASFIAVSQAYKDTPNANTSRVFSNISDMAELTGLLNDAIKEVSLDQLEIITDGVSKVYPKITKFDTIPVVPSNEGTTFTADQEGGQYEVYVSKNLRNKIKVISVASYGAYNNKGKAILADIRNPKRQNILGIYIPQKGYENEDIKINENGIFMHIGLLDIGKNNKNFTFETGSTYYLGRLGYLEKFPQSFYSSVVKIGYAQSSHQIFVSCDDPREFSDHDLPIGYIKPSYHGQPEEDYLLMNGQPQKIQEFPELFEYLKSTFEVEASPDGETFTTPVIVFSKDSNNPESTSKEEVIALIKARRSNVFSPTPPHPFIKRTFNEGFFSKEKPNKIDITPIVAGFGVLTQHTTIPQSTNIEVKVLVDARPNASTLSDRQWTEVHPGFKLINNHQYYGYDWKVEYTNDSTIQDITHTYGTWEVVFGYNALFEKSTAEIDGLGPRLEVNPFEEPLDISNMPTQIIVLKRDLWERYFDLDEVFARNVDNAVEVTPGIGTENSVSGQAVIDYITKEVKTSSLNVGKETLRVDEKNFILDTTKLAKASIKGKMLLADATKNFNISLKDGGAEYLKKDGDNYVEINNDSDLASLYAFENSKSLPASSLASKNFITKKIEDLKTTLIDTSNNYSASTILGHFPGTPSMAISNANKKSYGEFRIPILAHESAATTDGNIINNYTLAIGKTIEIESDIPSNVNASTSAKKSIISYTQNSDNASFDIQGKESPTKSIAPFKSLSISSSDKNKVKVFFDEGKIEISGNNSTWTIDGIIREGTSTLKAKKVNTEFLPKVTTEGLYPDYNIFAEGKVSTPADHKEDYNLGLLENAANAVSLMPTAAFKYMSADDNLKRWFGIITERIVDTEKSITVDNSKRNIEEKLSYTFTADQIASIKSYLKMVTNDDDSAQNILSTVGILTQATKELQDRLLKVEASTYGEDAESIPGEKTSLDSKAPSYATNTHSILGLNRLVKALCAEIFLDADPLEITQGGGTGPDPQRYSRLDKVCKAIYGQKSNENPGEGQEDIPLEVELGKTLPKESIEAISRKDSYEKTTKSITEDGNPFGKDYFEKNTDTTQRTENITKGTTTENFDGLNDAVNRISKKLNVLTKEINDVDNIGNGPKALDRIRDNIESLILEVYGEKYYDDSLSEVGNKTPFVKSSLSKVDLLGKNFYKTDEFIVTDKNNLKIVPDPLDPDYVVSERSFNGKVLHGKFKGTGQEGELTLKLPQETSDLRYATALDILIDYVVGSLSKAITETTPKEGTDLKGLRTSKILLERIKELESKLDLVSKKLSNKSFLEEITSTDYTTGSFTSVDELASKFKSLFGLETNSKNQWIKSTTTKMSPQDFIKIKEGDILSTKSDIDLVSQIQANTQVALQETGSKEALIKAFGPDYVIGKPDGKLEVPENTSATNDVAAILKTLYGEYDISKKETTYTHKIEKAEDNFNSEVISNLWGYLANLPQRYNSTGTQINANYDNDNLSDTLFILSDEKTKDENLGIYTENGKITNSQILSHGNRSSILNSERKNRFEVIEDNIRSIRKILVGSLDATGKNDIVNTEVLGKPAFKIEGEYSKYNVPKVSAEILISLLPGKVFKNITKNTTLSFSKEKLNELTLQKNSEKLKGTYTVTVKTPESITVNWSLIEGASKKSFTLSTKVSKENNTILLNIADNAEYVGDYTGLNIKNDGYSKITTLGGKVFSSENISSLSSTLQTAAVSFNIADEVNSRLIKLEDEVVQFSTSENIINNIISQELITLQKNYAKLQNDYSKLNTSHSELAKVVNSLRAKVGTLETTSETHTNDISALNTSYSNLNTKYDRLDNRVKALEAYHPENN